MLQFLAVCEACRLRTEVPGSKEIRANTEGFSVTFPNTGHTLESKGSYRHFPPPSAPSAGLSGSAIESE